MTQATATRKATAPTRGRFAPSPTGPLHFGSLVTAVASFLEARRQGGLWELRIEDIDPPREVPGAGDRILRALEAFGLHWDGPVVYQSDHLDAYQAALEQLTGDGHLYPCACTRREIRERASYGPDGPIYPGTCRNGLPEGRTGRSLRVLTRASHIHFADQLQGQQAHDLERDMGDFVVRRADGYYAYHLAAAVDDGDERISHVVRGIDLLRSTPRQIHLMQLLGLQSPEYAHIPVIVNAQGQKLSKQTGAAVVDPDRPGPALHRALRALAQAPPASLAGAGVAELLAWAREHWNPDALANRAVVPERKTDEPMPGA